MSAQGGQIDTSVVHSSVDWGSMQGIFKTGSRFEKKGLLVQIEGVDGSGKTSVMNAVRGVFDSRGCSTVVTNWNETIELYNLMMRLNAKGELDGKMRCILGAAELAARQQYVIHPVLSRGGIVFASKYLISMMAHSLIRGHDQAFLERLYSFATPPDLSVYFDLAPAIALERKLQTGTIGFWEAGLDLTLNLNLSSALSNYASGAIDGEFISSSFMGFQTRLREYHLRLLPKDAIVVDSTLSISHLTQQVVEIIDQRFVQSTDRIESLRNS